MRVIVHRMDEMENINKPLSEVELYNKVKDTIAADPGFIPLSEIKCSKSFALDSVKNHSLRDIYISKSDLPRFCEYVENAPKISDGTAVAELDHVIDNPDSADKHNRVKTPSKFHVTLRII